MCDVAERLENIGMAKGMAKGALALKDAIKEARNGIPYEKLVEVYGKEIADYALELK